jgi:hypothetical protein
MTDPSIFTALEAIRRSFEQHTATVEDLAEAKRLGAAHEDDAHFYKSRLEETTRERDDLLILSTQLCERVAICFQNLEVANRLATKFSQELSKRQLDRESLPDPIPLSASASTARQTLEALGRDQ